MRKIRGIFPSRLLPFALAITALSLALNSAQSSAFAASPVKVGAVCKSLGKLQTVGKLKFMCTWSGSKSVWAVLPTRTNTSKSNSSKANNSNTNGTGILNPIVPIAPQKVWNYVSAAEAEPNKDCNTSGATAFSLNGPLICLQNSWQLVKEVDDSVESRAYRSVLNRWDKQPEGNLALALYIDPAAGNWTNSIANGLNAGARFWGTSPADSPPLPAIITSNADFIDSTLQKLGIQQNPEDKARNHATTLGNSQAGAHNDGKQFLTYWDFLFTTVGGVDDSGFDAVAPHEYTHFAQRALSNNHIQGPGSMQWITEGLATYVGSALGPMANMPHHILTLFKVKAANSSASLNYLNGLGDQVFNDPQGNSIYSVGAIACEGLVALVGIEGVIAYYKDLAIGMDQESAYKKEFKLSGGGLTKFLNGYVESVKAQTPWSLEKLQSEYVVAQSV